VKSDIKLKELTDAIENETGIGKNTATKVGGAGVELRRKLEAMLEAIDAAVEHTDN